MKTMLDVVYEYLQTKDYATFKEIMAEVVEQSKVLWKAKFPTKLMKTIEEDKAAELYTLLSIDGRFLRDNDNNWSLVENYSYEEATRLRVAVSENISDSEEE